MEYGYDRKVLFQNEHCEVVEITWKPGEATQVHEHGADCCGVTKVLSGEIFETTYHEMSGRIVAGATNYYGPGKAITEEALGIHKVGNAGKEIAKTIHFYSPPARNKEVKLT